MKCRLSYLKIHMKNIKIWFISYIYIYRHLHFLSSPLFFFLVTRDTNFVNGRAVFYAPPPTSTRVRKASLFVFYICCSTQIIIIIIVEPLEKKRSLFTRRWRKQYKDEIQSFNVVLYITSIIQNNMPLYTNIGLLFLKAFLSHQPARVRHVMRSCWLHRF